MHNYINVILVSTLRKSVSNLKIKSHNYCNSKLLHVNYMVLVPDAFQGGRNTGIKEYYHYGDAHTFMRVSKHWGW